MGYCKAMRRNYTFTFHIKNIYIMISPTNFQSKHFMVLPAPNFRSTSELNFMVNLSGVVVIENFKGATNGDWHNETVHLGANAMGMDKVMNRIKNLLPALPANRPDGSSASWGFVPLQWTVYASFNSIYNAGTSVNAGYEIDDWKLVREDKQTITPPTSKVFEGMEVDLSVRDRDGEITKIGFEANLHGYYAIYWTARFD
jgi:hypothetical protein